MNPHPIYYSVLIQEIEKHLDKLEQKKYYHTVFHGEPEYELGEDFKSMLGNKHLYILLEEDEYKKLVKGEQVKTAEEIFEIADMMSFPPFAPGHKSFVLRIMEEYASVCIEQLKKNKI